MTYTRAFEYKKTKLYDTQTSKKDASVALKLRTWVPMEPPMVQILVVVANTQVRPLRTNEEKGSM